MLIAGRHPREEIATALMRAAVAGLEINEIHDEYRWGEVACTRCESRLDVYSTPGSPDSVTKRIDRFAAAHIHP